MKKYIKTAVVTTGLIVALAEGMAFAATSTFTTTVTFAAPLALTQVKSPNFGVVRADTTATYSLSTTGVVTTSGLGSVVSSAGAQSGQLTIAGSSLQTIDIAAGNYKDDQGVTPSNAVCAYNGGAPVAGCVISGAPAPGAGKTLLVGLNITADGTQADNSTASPTFDVNVVYH